MTTRLTFKQDHGTWTVELPKAGPDISLDAVLEFLVAPVLRAAGYGAQNIEGALHYDEMRAQAEYDRWTA